MTTTAVIETLTAEVRVLMVADRQVTLSVARQLDFVPYSQIDAWGRIRACKPNYRRDIEVIGRHESSGILARAWALWPTPYHYVNGERRGSDPEEYACHNATYVKAFSLPLIVLAGLK